MGFRGGYGAAGGHSEGMGWKPGGLGRLERALGLRGVDAGADGLGQVAPAVDLLHGSDKDAPAGGQQVELGKVEVADFRTCRFQGLFRPRVFGLWLGHRKPSRLTCQRWGAKHRLRSDLWGTKRGHSRVRGTDGYVVKGCLQASRRIETLSWNQMGLSFAVPEGSVAMRPQLICLTLACSGLAR